MTLPFRIQLVIVAIQLLMGVWIWIAPMKKIADPSKKLVIGCCYHSRRAASSQEAWDYAQKRFCRWCLLLAIPSAAVSFLTASLLGLALPENSTMALALAVLVPLLFLLCCRVMTERDLKQRNFEGN